MLLCLVPYYYCISSFVWLDRYCKLDSLRKKPFQLSPRLFNPRLSCPLRVAFACISRDLRNQANPDLNVFCSTLSFPSLQHRALDSLSVILSHKTVTRANRPQLTKVNNPGFCYSLIFTAPSFLLIFFAIIFSFFLHSGSPHTQPAYPEPGFSLFPALLERPLSPLLIFLHA